MKNITYISRSKFKKSIFPRRINFLHTASGTNIYNFRNPNSSVNNSPTQTARFKATLYRPCPPNEPGFTTIGALLVDLALANL